MAKPRPSGMSRRDFFARFAGRSRNDEAEAREKEESAGENDALHTFHVAAFPFHDGPVLVPSLRVGMTFSLAPDNEHLTDPHAVRISLGRDHLGYVPSDRSADVRARLQRGERLVCRAVRVDPAAELSKVLLVEITAADSDDEDRSVGEGDA